MTVIVCLPAVWSSPTDSSRSDGTTGEDGVASGYPPSSRSRPAASHALRLREGRTLPAVLVGRDREQSVIDQLLSAARSGRGEALAIVGEAGIGKSALL